jgi:hypothetical protein
MEEFRTYIRVRSSTLIAGSSVKELITTHAATHVPTRDVFSLRNCKPYNAGQNAAAMNITENISR